MDKNYGGVVWTNHAIARMQKRGIKQGDAWATWKRPDQSRYAESKGAWIYHKTYPVKLRNGASGFERIEVVASRGDNKKWIILSVWSKKVFGKEVKKQSGFGGFLRKLLQK